MMGNMTVIHNGFYASIQDEGRTFYRHLGVPHSGPMDHISAGCANEILKNQKNAAVVEMVKIGGTFLFTQPTYICIAGATTVVQLNQETCSMNEIITIKTGDHLEIGPCVQGNFIYLAICGGFQTSVQFHSRSYFENINSYGLLEIGSIIPYLSVLQHPITSNKFQTNSFDTLIKCYPGPEFHLLNRLQQEQLLNSRFSISKKWNRMAFQINEKIENKLPQLKSSPVLPGTVQLTPAGRLIVLMKDAQTTGGYPRVLQLNSDSIAQLSQVVEGASIDFIMVSNSF